MVIERVFELINNLDVREPLRKYAPQWSTVVVDASGEIIDVIRAKEWDFTIQAKYMKLYPGTVQFTANPGMYSTIDELKKKIEACVWTHKNA